MENKTKTKFCIRPFNSVNILTNGSIRTCCKIKHTNKYNIKKNSVDDFWQSKDREILAESFLNGEMPPECNVCWNDESKGVTSYREFSNTQYGILGNKKPAEYLKILNKTDLPAPEDYNLAITNLCNLKCYMCSGDDSSRLLIENNALGIESRNQDDYNTDDSTIDLLLEKIKNTELKHISLQGGEPLINPKIISLLRVLADNKKISSEVTINLTTNGTVYSKDIFDSLNKFKKLKIIFSIDGFGKVNDYLRFPSNFKKIKTNVENYSLLSNATFMITCTVQNINILYVNDMIQFAMENDMHLKLSNLHTPAYLQLNVLPLSTKQKALEKLSKVSKNYLTHVTNYDSIKNILESSIKEDQTENIKIFKKTIGKRDAYRKITMWDFVPELAADLEISR